MKRRMLIALLGMGTVWCLHAQSYTTAAGLRMGTDWGLTLQQRVLEHTTVEVILQSSLQREEMMLTVLGEQHQPILSRRLNIYGGLGLHKGFRTATDVGWGAPVGLTLVGGAEFTIARLALSWDFKPAINLSGGEKGFYAQTGVSVRYVFVKGNVFQKRQRQKKRERRRRAREKQGYPDWQIWRRQ